MSENENQQTPCYTFRLPVDIRKRLDEIAEEEEVSVASLIIDVLKAKYMKREQVIEG